MALASAKRFVEEGTYVFITGRRQEALDGAVKLIGRNVTGVRGDAANLDDLDRLFDTVKPEKGKIDVLFARHGRNRQTGRDYRATLRCGRRPEYARHAVCGSEGVAAVQRRRIDLHDRVDCFGERFSWFQRVFGEQGDVALIRTRVAQRTEGHEYPGERAEPGADRHSD
jgi:NAD(P)-dependent dehydrogenase (short-subunit alcohol dehydrogenase family)